MERRYACRWLYFLVISWAFPMVLWGQPAEWSLRADSTRIWVGDPLRLVWEARVFAEGEELVWPIWEEKDWAPLEPLRSGPLDTQQQKGVKIYSQEVWITGFDSGLYSVPSIPLKVQGEGIEPYWVAPDSLAVHVMTLPVDTTAAFRDIKDIIPAPFSWRPWLIGLLIALILAALAYWIYRRWKHRGAPAPRPAETGLPLHEQTLKKLEALEAEQWWQKGEVKKYYVELTEILRQYLEQRFQLAALERTTEELVQKMADHGELRAYREDLGRVLRNADLAKFARASLSPEDHKVSMEKARDFVRSTPEVIIERPKQ